MPVFLTACLAPEPTKAPTTIVRDVRKIPSTFPEEMIGRRRASSVTMKIYNTGHVRTKGGAMSSMKSWSAKIKMDMPVFLVKHPKEGYVLFDAGLSTATAERAEPDFFATPSMAFESEPGMDALSQIKADKIDPKDVRWVVLSHLHVENADRADDFPGATVVVSAKEWESAVRQEGRPVDERQIDPAGRSQWNVKLVFFSTAAPLGAFDRGVDLFGDGSIYLVDLPGHTPGSMGAWVNLDGGPVFLAGGAAAVIDNYMDLALPTAKLIWNLDAYWRSISQIRAMAEALPRLVVFPGQDLSPRTISSRTDLPLVPFPNKK
ncbi:MAG: N-acyl homoserine lactonase family protein [Proteobacteria bacterium]|nr:N-acyl homoserine lactonase family protein [Pseudomonadota bacterium]